MKKILSIAVILLILTVISCKKDNNSTNTTPIPTSTLVTQGVWKITYMKSNGSDKTADFTGYTFTFMSGGSASAIVGSFVTNGTWNSYNDDSQNKFYLDFGGTSPLSELKADWHIIEKTTLKIRLEDVSGGGSGTDLLTIEKM